MIHMMWHRRSCVSFALLSIVFTSISLPHVSKQCLGFVTRPLGALNTALRQPLQKLSVLKPVATLQFCGFDLCLLQWGFLSRHHSLPVKASASTGLQFQSPFSVSPGQFFFIPTCTTPLFKSLPLCFSPSGDAISVDHYHLILIGLVLLCTSAVLQSCCSPADQRSQLRYLNAALLVMC